jgi:hypothetical protein
MVADGVTNLSAASNLAAVDGRSKMATNPQIILDTYIIWSCTSRILLAGVEVDEHVREEAKD